MPMSAAALDMRERTVRLTMEVGELMEPSSAIERTMPIAHLRYRDASDRRRYDGCGQS
jgi:hypothetical protein